MIWPQRQSSWPQVRLRILLSAVLALAKTGMHLTETKHHLAPPALADHSQDFLNADRVVSLVLGSYYGIKLVLTAWYSVSSQPPSFLFKLFQIKRFGFDHCFWTAGVGLLGLAAMGIGETSFNTFTYPLLHTFWHASVYTVLYRLI